MKRIFYLIAVCAVMMSVSGCYRHRYPYDKLAEADGLMEEHFDSAWTILNAIDTAAISSEANRAYYALLYAQCQYKQYIYETDDSLISTAVDYYTRHDDRRKLMRSYYYRGLIHMTNNAYAKSVSDVVMAERLARRLEDTLFLARTNETLADLYNRAYNVKEAINKGEMAHAYYQSIPGKERNALFSAVDMAINYAPDGDHKKSLHILDSLVSVIPRTDSALLSYIYGTYIFAYFYDKEPDKAVEAFYTLKRYSPEYYGDNVPIPKIAEVFFMNNQNDSAEYYLALYEKNRNIYDDETYYRVRYELAKKAGVYDSALENLERMATVGNEKIGRMLSENIAVVERNSIGKENERNLERADRLLFVVLLLGFILTIVVLVVILLRLKIKYQRREIDEKMSSISSLSREISNLNNNVKRVNSEQKNSNEVVATNHSKIRTQNVLLNKQIKLIENIFSTHIETLDILSKEYFEKKGAEVQTRATVLKNLEHELLKLSNKDSMKMIEEVVNKIHNNILTDIRSELPALTDKDISLLTLFFAGFSAKSICLVMNWQVANFYNRKRRIREKIEVSDVPHRERFLAALGK